MKLIDPIHAEHVSILQCVFAIELFCQASSPIWASIEMEMNDS